MSQGLSIACAQAWGPGAGQASPLNTPSQLGPPVASELQPVLAYLRGSEAQGARDATAL